MDERAGGQVVRVARERRPDGSAVPLGRDVKYSTSVVRRVIDTDEPLKTTLQKGGEDLELGNSVYDLKRSGGDVRPDAPGGGVRVAVFR